MKGWGWVVGVGVAVGTAACGGGASIVAEEVEAGSHAVAAEAEAGATELVEAAADALPTGVVHFGTMHAVMTSGADGAVSLVSLGDVLARPGAFGLGAATSLDGEVTVRGGQALISRTRGEGFTTDVYGADATEGAALLTVAYVDGWTEVAIPDGLDQAAFEAFLATAATEAGVDTSTPFPFEVEGTLTDVRLHLLNGVCPMRPGAVIEDAQRPYVLETSDGMDGVLVGFHALNSVGQLTHPGTSVHVHAVLTHDGRELTGHVERFAIGAGATLRLPTSF